MRFVLFIDSNLSMEPGNWTTKRMANVQISTSTQHFLLFPNNNILSSHSQDVFIS